MPEFEHRIEYIQDQSARIIDAMMVLSEIASKKQFPHWKRNQFQAVQDELVSALAELLSVKTKSGIPF